MPISDFTLDRMVNAVERVRERLARATRALDEAGVAYAVIGGNAVAAWVVQVDEAAVRNTQDVDILLRREDLSRASAALAPAGFIQRHVKGIDMFLDGPGARARDAVHVIFAGEKVKPDDLCPAPGLDESERGSAFQILSLPSLIRMKLTSYRRKDQVHIQDLIEVGLIDQSALEGLMPELGARLQALLDDPEG